MVDESNLFEKKRMETKTENFQRSKALKKVVMIIMIWFNFTTLRNKYSMRPSPSTIAHSSGSNKNLTRAKKITSSRHPRIVAFIAQNLFICN